MRFEQLESSIAVDMWQEAFRAIEEIHKLLNMSGKSPKASEWLLEASEWLLEASEWLLKVDES